MGIKRNIREALVVGVLPRGSDNLSPIIKVQINQELTVLVPALADHLGLKSPFKIREVVVSAVKTGVQKLLSGQRSLFHWCFTSFFSEWLHFGSTQIFASKKWLHIGAIRSCLENPEHYSHSLHFRAETGFLPRIMSTALISVLQKLPS